MLNDGTLVFCEQTSLCQFAKYSFQDVTLNLRYGRLQVFTEADSGHSCLCTTSCDTKLVCPIQGIHSKGMKWLLCALEKAVILLTCACVSPFLYSLCQLERHVKSSRFSLLLL